MRSDGAPSFVAVATAIALGRALRRRRLRVPALELARRIRVEVAAPQLHHEMMRLAERRRDRLRARVGLELRHRLAHVRAHGLRGDVERLADLLVREPVGEQAQHLALTLRERRRPVGEVAAHEDAGEHRIDVRLAGRDPLGGADEVGERRLLEHEAARPDVERLGEERAVAERGVEDDRRSGAVSRRWAATSIPESCGMRTSTIASAALRLDQPERLRPVPRAADDRESAAGEDLRDRGQHRRVVVGDDTGDGIGHALAGCPMRTGLFCQRYCPFRTTNGRPSNASSSRSSARPRSANWRGYRPRRGKSSLRRARAR